MPPFCSKHMWHIYFTMMALVCALGLGAVPPHAAAGPLDAAPPRVSVLPTPGVSAVDAHGGRLRHRESGDPPRASRGHPPPGQPSARPGGPTSLTSVHRISPAGWPQAVRASTAARPDAPTVACPLPPTTGCGRTPRHRPISTGAGQGPRASPARGPISSARKADHYRNPCRRWPRRPLSTRDPKEG